MILDRSRSAWLVDLDGTLYRAGPLKALMALDLALSGWSAIATLRTFRAQHEALRELADSDDDPFTAQLRLTAEKMGLTEDRVRQLVSTWMFERPCRYLPWFRRNALVEELNAFRQQGGRLALVSDYPAVRKAQALGVIGLFDAVVASGEPGGPRRLKPDPEGYLTAAGRLGVAPEDCLVVGDREDADGAAAAAAGMAFHLIR